MNKFGLVFLIALVAIFGMLVVGAFLSQKPDQPMPIQPQPLQTQPEKPKIKPQATYEGPWVTGGQRKRHLNGVMTAVVTNTAENQWKGRFFGVWEGVRFDYTVNFTGPAEKLAGTATIDGAFYTWTGSIVGNEFNGTFTSSRYDGNFQMKEKP